MHDVLCTLFVAAIFTRSKDLTVAPCFPQQASLRGQGTSSLLPRGSRRQRAETFTIMRYRTRAPSAGSSQIFVALPRRPLPLLVPFGRGRSISRGHLEIAWLLLEKGADPNAKNPDGNTPLHRATQMLAALALSAWTAPRARTPRPIRGIEFGSETDKWCQR